MPGAQKGTHDADMDESTLSAFGPKWLWWRSRRLRFFFERLAVTHFVGDKAVNWISVFFTDGVSAKCSFLSFKCSMFTVQLHPPLHFCLSLLTADGPVWTLKCCISYISYITCAPCWNCEGSLCEHQQRESFGRCAKHMDCSGQGEIGKLGFSFTETRCYFSVGGNVNPEKPYEVFKFLPASICSTCVLFFFLSDQFLGKIYDSETKSEGCSPKQSFDATPYQNSADCRGRMSACWCQFWRFEPLELKLWDKTMNNKRLNS